MFVAKRMTPNPITINSNTTVAEAGQIMKNNKFRRLPVVDDGKLVGIVTDRDLREVSPSPATTLSVHELNYLLAKMKVKDIMKKKVLTISQNAAIEEAALMMYTHKIGGLVVVDDSGAVAGIITDTDIFKCFVDVMGLPQGKTRLTVDVKDEIGTLHDVTDIFKQLGINITSFAAHPQQDGTAELVIRADVIETEELAERLGAAGFKLKHVVHIGNGK